MNFETLISRLLEDTTQKSLGLFAPELVLCATIVVLMFVRLCGCDKKMPTYWVALVGAFVGFALTLTQFKDFSGAEELFTGLLVYDQFTVFFRLFLLLFLVLVVALTVLSGIPDDEDGPDFYTLLLGAVVGMMLMSSANHLLILFLGIEMASVPSYVMVGFLKGRRLSSEAALKFVVYGAGAAGVMLYGISLLAGLLGTANLPELASQLNLLLDGEQAGMSNAVVRTVVLAIVMILVGLAFKLSIVPFHFWCPDAFEGASAEVAGFLSVASKAAAFALLVRFLMMLVGDTTGAMADVYLHLGIGIGVLATVSATFGNLAAYAQSNVKRLLAYSTIAHAGYMLMAVSALMVIRNAPAGVGIDVDVESRRCLEGLLYYLGVYLFMNLGAFAIVALIRNQTFSEEIEDYRGLGSQAPVLCVCMAICMFSLVGVPPLGGFIGKFMIFASLFTAGYAHWAMWVILVLGGLNTVFSLFYYIRVLKAMYLEAPVEGARTIQIPFRSATSFYVLMVSVPILLLGMTPLVANLSEKAQEAVLVLFR